VTGRAVVAPAPASPFHWLGAGHAIGSLAVTIAFVAADATRMGPPPPTETSEGNLVSLQARDEKVTTPKQMTRPALRKFIEALAASNPEPETELEYTTPFTLLVAVVLSAQATDVSVNRVSKALFADAPNPDSMVDLGVDGVARHIKSIGLWQAKAKNVVALSRQLIEKHSGEVPRDRESLEALPGVGRKTANVVMNVAFGESTMAVDTHIFRIGNRTGASPGTTPRAVEDGLVARIPPDLLRHAHHWLILHGRYVCKARKPECWRCAAKPWCLYRDKTPAPEA
jgi:endonuclease III